MATSHEPRRGAIPLSLAHLRDSQIDAVIGAAKEGFLLVDAERQIIWANPALRAMFGLESADLLGRSSSELRSLLTESVEDPASFLSRNEEIYQDEATIIEDEIVKISQPRSITTSRTSVPVVSKEGEYVGRLWIYRDVTKALAAERAKAELEATNRRLVELSETKSIFLSTISHELRTPLTAVLAHSDLIKRRQACSGNEKDLQHIEVILRGGERLKSLIDDLLDVSDFESTVMRIRESRFFINDAVSSAIDSIAPVTAPKHQRIVLEQCSPDAQIVNDRERFEQILGNLLSNASKYSVDGSVIRVVAYIDGNAVKVSVNDQGEGIDQSNLFSLFEPFYRGDDELTRSTQGAGLGLTISRSLARAMRGDLEVSSELGTGSTFTFGLPLIEGEWIAS